jgi:hypothetical protein
MHPFESIRARNALEGWSASAVLSGYLLDPVNLSADFQALETEDKVQGPPKLEPKSTHSLKEGTKINYPLLPPRNCMENEQSQSLAVSRVKANYTLRICNRKLALTQICTQIHTF